MSPTSTSYIAVARRLAVLVLLTLPLATLSAGCGSSDQTVPTAPTPPTGPTDMQVVDVVVGTGATLNTGNQGTFIYTLWHYDPAGTDGKGVLIESAPYAFRPGVTNVILGVSQGVLGEQVGGTRRLTIPPSLAYGSTGNGQTIAPNEWIVFEFQLLDVKDCAVVACQT